MSGYKRSYHVISLTEMLNKFQLSQPVMLSDCDPKDLRAAYNLFVSPLGQVARARVGRKLLEVLEMFVSGTEYQASTKIAG